MNYRDWLQQVIYKIINPVVHGMIRIGITPNFITTTGLVLNIVAAALFVYAGVYKSGELAYSVLQPVAIFSEEAVKQADSFIRTGKTGAKSEKQLFDCLLITKDNVNKYSAPFVLDK